MSVDIYHLKGILLMKTFVTTLLAASLGFAGSQAVAQESNEDILERLTQKVGALSDSVNVKPGVANEDGVVAETALALFSELVIVDREVQAPDTIAKPAVPEREPKLDTDELEAGGIEMLGDENLMIPLRELPSGSRFSFSKTLFFPANTTALIYVNGAANGKVYEGGKPFDSILNATDVHHSACALITDKSYIKLRGKDTSVTPTFIDFDKIEYIKDGNSNRIIYQLSFVAKPAGGHSVNIKMACVLPVEKNTDVPGLEMRHVVDSFGQSFTFEPPKYVEL
jgi:hypothetical protein